MRGAWAIIVLVSLSAAPLHGASPGPSVNIQNFQPVPSGLGFFSTDSGQLLRPLSLTAGGYLHYGHQLFKVAYVNQDGTPQQDVGSIVAHRLDFNVQGAFGILPWLEVGLTLPLILFQGGFERSAFEAGNLDFGVSELNTLGIGDIRLYPKFRLFHMEDNLISLAFLTGFSLPTAAPGKAFVGEKFMTATPMVLASSQMGKFRAGLNVGARLRQSADLTPNITNGNEKTIVGHEWLGRGALSYTLWRNDEHTFDAVGEVFLSTPLTAPFGAGKTGLQAAYARALTPMEGLLGVRWRMGQLLNTVGVGGGLLPGYGSPVPRIFVGAAFDSGTTILADKDKDGIPDTLDACPDRPEDMDGFEDEDGCPESDNDKDGILDEDDMCPLDAEDRDSFEDEDGCPEPDNDKDGILDGKDICPLQPEDMDGVHDDDGCPEEDDDNDGILDAQDKCPSQAEDKDGFEDEDGCPELDNDKDGLPDLNDVCPLYAEDLDGVADDDGCPEDNDQDGIPDALDKCPNEAEIYNGIDDGDGCPEKEAAPSLVQVTEDKIEIKESVYFTAGKAVIDSKSFPLLKQIASVLNNYKHIEKVRIEGHTDNQGQRKANIKLSQDRANAVRDYLIGQGIGKQRLEALGVGPDKPVASNKTPVGRESNRRVEFVIVSLRPMGEAVQAKPVQPLPAPTQQPGATTAPPPAPTPSVSAPTPAGPGASAPGEIQFEMDLGPAPSKAPEKPAGSDKKKKDSKKKGKGKK